MVVLTDEQVAWFRGSIDSMNDLLNGKPYEECDGYDVAKNIVDELDCILIQMENSNDEKQ